MKKLSVIIASILILGTSVSFAQNGFAIGIRGGINQSQIKGEGSGSDQSFWNTDQSRTTGFTGGVFVRIGNKVFVQPELIFSQKGGKTTNLLGVEQNFKQTYIDIPVLLGFRIGEVVRINAGPMASFLINEDDTFLEKLGVVKVGEGFRKAVLGYQAGVGFDIGKINLDMRYEGNVNDVFNINYNDQQTKSQFAGKGNLWFITAGFRF